MTKFIKLFIIPLLKFKPKNLHLEDFLEKILCVHTRIIDRYRVLETFKMPGNIWDSHKRYPARNKRVLEGEVIFVRHDKKSDMYDVEAKVTNKKKWEIFTMNSNQYKLIKDKLELIPQKTTKKRHLSWQRGL